MVTDVEELVNHTCYDFGNYRDTINNTMKISSFTTLESGLIPNNIVNLTTLVFWDDSFDSNSTAIESREPTLKLSSSSAPRSHKSESPSPEWPATYFDRKDNITVRCHRGLKTLSM